MYQNSQTLNWIGMPIYPFGYTTMETRRVVSFFNAIWRIPCTRVIISLSILVFLLIWLPVSDLWNTVKRISLTLWTLSVIVFLVGHVLGSIKWCLLANMGKSRLPLSTAFRCYFSGLFANLFLPSLAGGDVVRAGMAIRSNNEKEPIILATLLDRFLDISSLLLITLLGALLTPPTLAYEDRKVILWVFLILLIFPLCGVLLLIIPLPKRMPKKLSETVIRIRDIIKHLIKNPARALVGLGMAIFVQGGFVLLNAFLGARCGIHLPLSIWFLTWPLAKLTAMLPISLGGLGVREVALAALLGRFDISTSTAVGFGLLWETVSIAGGVVGGISCFLLSRNIPRSDVFATPRDLRKKEGIERTFNR